MRKIITYFLIILIISVAFIIIQDKETSDVEVKIFFVEKLPEEEVETIKFCAVNKYDNFDLIEIEVPKDIDIYEYVFELYNYKRNTLPIEYDVYSPYLLDLESISKVDDVLYIKIKDQKIPGDDFHWTMYALKVTYKYLGIKEMNVKINGKQYTY